MSVRNDIIIVVALLLLFTGDWTFWVSVLVWASVLPPAVPALTWFLVSVGCLVSGMLIGSRLGPEKERVVVVKVPPTPKVEPHKHVMHYFRSRKEFDLI